MARIVVAGAGAIGASIAYHLALAGADDVVLCDRAQVGAGSTGKAMGGVRQQFSTAPEVRLAQASIRFFEHLGPPFIEGLEVGDVVGAVACWEDGIADPAQVTRELVRQATERGVELVEGVSAADLEREVLVVACGPWSADLGQRVGVELPIRPLCRQLVDTAPVAGLPVDLPMVVEAETGFHFRRVDGALRLAMAEPTLRWGFEELVDDELVSDWLRRLARRYPPAANTAVARAWAGLYDMTPDAHPIIGWASEGVYAACGFSGHGFMQSPAVGRAAAEEILEGASEFDLTPFRLERFAGGAVFPEKLVL